MMFWQQRWWIRSKIQATNPALVKDSRNEKSGQRFEKNPPFRPLQTLPSGTAGVCLRTARSISAALAQGIRWRMAADFSPGAVEDSSRKSTSGTST